VTTNLDERRRPVRRPVFSPDFFVFSPVLSPVISARHGEFRQSGESRAIPGTWKKSAKSRKRTIESGNLRA
jgi:hypothetical protein